MERFYGRLALKNIRKCHYLLFFPVFFLEVTILSVGGFLPSSSVSRGIEAEANLLLEACVYESFEIAVNS